jgi:hypothetical protein
MKLKSIPLLLLLPALMLLLVACEGPGSALEKRIVGPPTATPDIEATVEALVEKRLAAIPTPTARIVVKEVEVIVEKEVRVVQVEAVEVVVGAENTFKDMDAVFKALDKHNITNCEEFGWIEESGAIDGTRCDVTSSDKASTMVEFHLWEENNAEKACIPTFFINICSEVSYEAHDLRFYGNIHLLVYKDEDDEDNVVSVDDLISDLND